MAEGATKEGLCARSQIRHGSAPGGDGNSVPFIPRTWDEDDTLVNSSTYTNLELEKGAEKGTVREADWRRPACRIPL